MSVSFNQDSVFNLKPISLDDVRGELQGLLIEGESAVMAFRTVRDQLVFTNKRIVSIDVQGITGRRKSFTSMPYSKIQFFCALRTFYNLVEGICYILFYHTGFTKGLNQMTK